MTKEQKYALQLLSRALDCLSIECEKDNDFTNRLGELGWFAKSIDEIYWEALDEGLKRTTVKDGTVIEDETMDETGRFEVDKDYYE